MSELRQSERTLFVEAIDLPAGEERTAYLDQCCGKDRELRRRVESLLTAHDSSQEPLARFGFGDDADDASPLTVSPISESPFDPLDDGYGPYKPMEQIGEGGFAVVFMAEQQRPVRRRVALKIIKPGMDTRQVLARFEAERQALAMMDHPNIAKVFDAGTTDDGRPYFVMELVRGVPITEYCDQCDLTTRERLKLFITVCEAVQHAHQKGVIHRDIKPTNVLAEMQDGRAAPKVIDFGVAKAINHRLTEHSIATGFSQIVGTPLYMSPEQAELSPLGVDTRSDIYSLGVLLYELLVGATPFDKERLLAAPYHEMCRIICEEQPLLPSARLSTLAADCASTIAEHRRTEQRRLVLAVSGDLDWIAMKCLEKDRNRRYETANGLARDVQRYLNDEPVHACPPSAVYRFGKFARRNKFVLAAGSAIVAVLLLFVVALAISNRMITAERNEKTQALAEREQALRRVETERQRAEENFRRARVAVRDTLFDASQGKGEWSELAPSLREKLTQQTISFYQSLLQNESTDPSLQYETAVGYRSLAALHLSMSQPQKARQCLSESIEILESISIEYPTVIEYRHQLAYSLYLTGANFWQPDQVASILQRSAELYQEVLCESQEKSDVQKELAKVYNALGWFLSTYENSDLRHPARAVESASKAVQLAPEKGNYWNSLGIAQFRAGHHRAAIESLNHSMQLRQGGDSFDWFFFAMVEWHLGKRAKAQKTYLQAVEWMDQHKPTDKTLLRFRNEAGKLLGVNGS